MCKTIVIEFMDNTTEELVNDTLKEIEANLFSQDTYCTSIKDIRSQEDKNAS